MSRRSCRTSEELYRTYKSRRYTVGQIGSIVRVAAGDTSVFCIVTALRMLEDSGAGASDEARGDMKWLGSWTSLAKA